MILDAIALALAICVTIGRGFFALGRDGLLPKAFARTSRFDTPWVGNLMVVVGGVGADPARDERQLLQPVRHPRTRAASSMPIFPNDQFATFIMAATVGSFAVELVYLMLAVAMAVAPRQARRQVVAVHRHGWWRSRRRCSASTAH